MCPVFRFLAGASPYWFDRIDVLMPCRLPVHPHAGRVASVAALDERAAWEALLPASEAGCGTSVTIRPL